MYLSAIWQSPATTAWTPFVERHARLAPFPKGMKTGSWSWIVEPAWGKTNAEPSASPRAPTKPRSLGPRRQPRCTNAISVLTGGRKGKSRSVPRPAPQGRSTRAYCPNLKPNMAKITVPKVSPIRRERNLRSYLGPSSVKLQSSNPVFLASNVRLEQFIHPGGFALNFAVH
jgi:hypothetical protein